MGRSPAAVHGASSSAVITQSVVTSRPPVSVESVCWLDHRPPALAVFLRCRVYIVSPLFLFFLSKHRSRVKWCPPSDGLHKVKIHTEAGWPGLLEDFHFSLLLIQFHTFSIDFALMHFHKYFHNSKSSQMLYFMLT